MLMYLYVHCIYIRLSVNSQYTTHIISIDFVVDKGNGMKNKVNFNRLYF